MLQNIFDDQLLTFRQKWITFYRLCGLFAAAQKKVKYRNKQMEQLSLREIQLKVLELMVEFDALCRKYGIDYRVSGGTLLGAIRHKGFIPWDDDIDVMMLREEYDKFLEAAGQMELPENRKIVSLKDNSFPRNYARYIRTDYIKREDMFEEDDCQWLGMDIFPVDFVPGDSRYDRQVKKMVFLRKLLLTSVTEKGTGKTKAKAIAKNILRPAAKLMGSYRIARRMDKLQRKYNGKEREYVASIAGVYVSGERWKYSEYLPSSQVEFEGHLFRGPGNYKIYLINMFGDYMQLPPEDQRKYSAATVFKAET